MDLSESISNAVKADLLCIADSNWVLGHWYTNCMLNGRELTDFTSMAGIAEDKLGHTRALFRFMEEYFDLPEYQLEFGRDVGQIHSMDLLDAPPENWADFILTLYLADVAIWRFSNTLREGSFAPIANLITKFGEETYFHQLCIDGWLKALDNAERAALSDALPQRLPRALAWFQNASAEQLLSAGIRTQSLADARRAAAETIVNKLSLLIDIDDVVLNELIDDVRDDHWDARRRRVSGSVMPPRLWESIVPTSEDALLARRPLSVSVDDNIDLFVKARKDETEPHF